MQLYDGGSCSTALGGYLGVAGEPTEQHLSAKLALFDELLAQLLKGILLLLLVEASLGCLPSFRPRPNSPSLTLTPGQGARARPGDRIGSRTHLQPSLEQVHSSRAASQPPFGWVFSWHIKHAALLPPSRGVAADAHEDGRARAPSPPSHKAPRAQRHRACVKGA